MQALAHFLRLLVEQLLRHFLPRKAQIAHHRHQPQSDIRARREQQRTVIVVMLLRLEPGRHRVMRQIARRNDVRQRTAAQAADAAALRQVGFDEIPMLAGNLRKRIERLHDARALGPAAAHAARQRDHRHHAIAQCLHPEFPIARRKPTLRIHDIAGLHVFDRGC